MARISNSQCRTRKRAGLAFNVAWGVGAALLVLAGPILAGEAPVPTAVFDFELLDTSLQGEVEGENPDETRRLHLISDLLRDQLGKTGQYAIVDLSPAEPDIAEAGHLHGCNGCEAAIARGLGAKLAVTGLVQKVSNLILSINIHFRDAESGAILKSASADIRGNTDQSWTRGVTWLVKNRLTDR